MMGLSGDVKARDQATEIRSSGFSSELRVVAAWPQMLYLGGDVLLCCLVPKQDEESGVAGKDHLEAAGRRR